VIDQPSEFDGLPLTMIAGPDGFGFTCAACNLRHSGWWASRQGAGFAALDHIELEHDPLPDRLELAFDEPGPIVTPEGGFLDIECGEDNFEYTVSNELRDGLMEWYRIGRQTRRTTSAQTHEWRELGRTLAERSSVELGRPVEFHARRWSLNPG
jgi:hypothetical protein